MPYLILDLIPENPKNDMNKTKALTGQHNKGNLCPVQFTISLKTKIQCTIASQLVLATTLWMYLFFMKVNFDPVMLTLVYHFLFRTIPDLAQHKFCEVSEDENK